MNIAHKGFTLAELLIALALLGIIAAFTIPKVLNASSSSEKTAKIREAAATLEQAWYNVKMKNAVDTSQGLYGNIVHTLNYSAADPGAVDAAGAPLEGITQSDGTTVHPCRDTGTVGAAWGGGPGNVASGWVQFQNGVIITGLNSGPTMNNNDWFNTANDGTNTYVICIDYNGKALPNKLGDDVFIGNFNQWGCFAKGVGCNAGGTAPASETEKDFNWGGNGGNLVVYDGTAAIAAGTPLGGAGGPGDPASNDLVGQLMAN